MKKQNKPKPTIVDQLLSIIREAEAQGITRYQIAKRCGISEGQLSRLVNRTVIPRLETAERIGRVIGYRLEFTRTEKP